MTVKQIKRRARNARKLDKAVACIVALDKEPSEVLYAVDRNTLNVLITAYLKRGRTREVGK